MRIIFCQSVEVHMSGSAAELTELAGALASGRESTVAADDDQPAPGDVRLTAVEIRAVPTTRVVISVDADRSCLVVTGDADGLAILGENIQSLADSDVGGHDHIEYFPEHYYVDAQSIPLIVDSPHGGMPGGCQLPS